MFMQALPGCCEDPGCVEGVHHPQTASTRTDCTAEEEASSCHCHPGQLGGRGKWNICGDVIANSTLLFL